jgi:glucokinase
VDVDAPFLVPVLEIGGSHATAGLIDVRSWSLVGQPARIGLDPHGGKAELVTGFSAAASGVATPHSRRWGVAMPGPFDYTHGVGEFREVGKFESLSGVDVRQELTNAIDPRPAHIHFINDADAFALGEWRFGSGRGTARCVGLTLGTGIGSGWIEAGRCVQSGPTVPPGGRANVIEVEGVPLEDIFSARALERSYAQVSGRHHVDVRSLAQDARSGDMGATAVLHRGATALGAALGPYLRDFDPDVVVLGGSIIGAWDLIGPPFLGATAQAGYRGRTMVSGDQVLSALLGTAYATIDPTSD